MGNVQVLSGFYTSGNPADLPISLSRRDSLEYNDDINSAGNIPESFLLNDKVACEYCQEYCFPQFHQQHIRICPCNPTNIRSSQGQQSERSMISIQSNVSNELEKALCSYCHEPCFLKYRENHQRICPKNPENIRVNCRSCNKTFNLVAYQNHLDSCEESSHQRRRSATPTERNFRSTLSNMRKFKTNTDINFEDCERPNKPVGVTKPVIVTKQEPLECPICLEHITTQFDLRNLPCNHKFHRHCINNWSCVQTRCPICRKDFY